MAAREVEIMADDGEYSKRLYGGGGQGVVSVDIKVDSINDGDFTEAPASSS